MKGRKLLMIPGPVEFEPAVLAAMSEPTDSHVSPDFIESFGAALDMLKMVFLAPQGQPFVVSGSGTLAMEMAVVNLIEPMDKVLVISTGYFGVRYRDLLNRYGVDVTFLTSPIGDTPSIAQVEKELRHGAYRLIVVTHVDTSTGVKSDVKALAKLAHRHEALIVVDGVAAAGGETLCQEEWGIDVYLTASQKAIGVPPGLALLVVSPQALTAYRTRKTPVENFYADFSNWLPVMEAYGERQVSYFGTPPVNLVRALEVSLRSILAEGMEARFARHAKLAAAFRAAVASLGLHLVPVRQELVANTLSAVYFPEGVNSNMLSEVSRQGVILAGGLHPDIKTRYFRVGHMGSVNQGDVLATVGAIEAGLNSVRYRFEPGVGLRAAQQVLLGSYTVA